MWEKLQEVERRFDELTDKLSSQEIASKPGEFQAVAKERASIEAVVLKLRELRAVAEQVDDAQELVAQESDPEMVEMAKAEIGELEAQKATLEKDLELLLLPKDPNDERNVILEIRAGTGGEEAALFAGDLMRMYLRLSERHKWKAEMLSVSESDRGGVREATIRLAGNAVYSHLKFEAGVHRVQRVPETESQGRIHTSAASVAILPEAEEVDLKIDPGDLRIDVYRSSGPGGQSVNTTDSAVRMTHLPTGITVAMQDEKSQHKNKAKALVVLRSRVLEAEQKKAHDERAEMRRGMVGSGDRSDKIRTYNFPQDRLTDHRIGLTRHNLDAVLDGDLDDVIVACRTHFQAEALKASRS